MIAQDNLSFRISIGIYDNKYLDYIFGAGRSLVVPPPGENTSIPFLRVQEFGPFNVEDRDQMEGLCRIVLSLLIWQLDLSDKGQMIEEALQPQN